MPALTIGFFLWLLTTTVNVVPVVKIDQIERLMGIKSDTLYVVNFWATWCKPCVEEIPAFDSAAIYFTGRRIKIIMVSLDFKSQYDSKLIPFIKNNRLTHDVWLLDEPDYNSWINKIDSSWSGAIPATLFIDAKNQKRSFHEGGFTSGELIQKIQNLKTNKQ